MTKTYADLHLRADISNLQQATGMIRKASQLGYNLIAIPLPAEPEDRFRRLKAICKENGIDLASRVDLKPSSPDNLLQSLRKLRRKVEIIAVFCDSKPVARQAGKDRRVDILNLPSNDFRKRCFDLPEAQLASSSMTSLEVDMSPLLTLEGAPRARLLSFLRREVETARAFHVPVILSSGVSDELLMRKPQDMAAITFLFDMDKENARRGVSSYPTTIVERNREKLSSRFVAPGIHVVKRGGNC